MVHAYQGYNMIKSVLTSEDYDIQAAIKTSECKRIVSADDAIVKYGVEPGELIDSEEEGVK